jgi:hypothetical protein
MTQGFTSLVPWLPRHGETVTLGPGAGQGVTRRGSDRSRSPHSLPEVERGDPPRVGLALMTNLPGPCCGSLSKPRHFVCVIKKLWGKGRDHGAAAADVAIPDR